MATLEETNAKIAELTAAIQAKGADAKTTLQWDDVKKDFETHINEMVAAQVQEKMDSQPVRRGVAGAPVLSGDSKALLKNNRYAKMVRDFEAGDVHKSGILHLRPIDLLIAAKMMEGQVKAYHPSFNGGAPAPMSDDLKNALKAMDSTTAGSGDEYVPTILAPQLWDDFFLASKVVGMLQRIEMPSNPFDLPLGLGSVTWRKGGENVAVSASNPTTAKVTMAATEIVTEQNWSYTLDEDSAIAMAPAIRARLAQSGAEAMDAFALNADDTSSATGNINLDDATPPSDSYYLQSGGQDGIRHQYLVDNTTPMGSDENGTLEDATLVAEMGAMGKYAADPSKLAFVCDVKTYLTGFLSAATGAPGVNTITMDKFGAGAVVLTGQLAAYRGVPIVVSASMPLTEADGKVSVTAANNTKGQLAIINRTMWYVGFRRNLLIEADRDIQKRQYLLVTSFREGIVAWGTRSTNIHTGGIFNIT